jgi:DNA polymerase/3'-5' exonuclease PolX
MGDKNLIKTAKLQSHAANAAVIAMLDDYAREEAAMGRAKLAQTARKALYQVKRHAFPIETEKQALSIRYVGPYIAKKIMVVVDAGRTAQEKALAVAKWAEVEVL